MQDEAKCACIRIIEEINTNDKANQITLQYCKDFIVTITKSSQDKEAKRQEGEHFIDLIQKSISCATINSSQNEV